MMPFWGGITVRSRVGALGDVVGFAVEWRWFGHHGRGRINRLMCGLGVGHGLNIRDRTLSFALDYLYFGCRIA